MPRANYGNSAWDIPNRFVGYALWKLPNVHTQSFLKYISNDWSFDDSFQIQDGLPFTLGTSSYNSYAALNTGWNGSGASSFVPEIGIDNSASAARWSTMFACRRKFHLGIATICS
jgi:hypothetical protein